MNPHVIELLGAYHDGELTTDRRHQVEDHLQGCPACRAELEALAELSSFLDADAVPDQTPPERFAAQVQLRLPRAPRSRQNGERPGELHSRPRWVLGVPLALIGASTFLQAAIWVTAFALTAVNVVYPSEKLFSGWIPTEGLFEIGANLLLFNAILLIGTIILWSAWMAVWLAWKRNQNESFIKGDLPWITSKS
jgi:anti-sigma factor RsiW